MNFWELQTASFSFGELQTTLCQSG